MLQRFHLHQFRNYRDQSFVPDPAVTVVTGENGSGKTSLLEAIYLLGAGRSFRTSRLSSLVMADNADCTLFAEIESDQGNRRVGIKRDRQSLLDARLDGERVSGLSDIARLFPVQVLHPGTVELVEEVLPPDVVIWTGLCSTWNTNLSRSGGACAGRWINAIAC